MCAERGLARGRVCSLCAFHAREAEPSAAPPISFWGIRFELIDGGGGRDALRYGVSFATTRSQQLAEGFGKTSHRADRFDMLILHKWGQAVGAISTDLSSRALTLQIVAVCS